MAVLCASVCIQLVRDISTQTDSDSANLEVDTLMARMYNQNGNLYNGLFECLHKTIATEGLLALYKGFFAHLARILPHTILTLTLAEQTNKLVRGLETRLSQGGGDEEIL